MKYFAKGILSVVTLAALIILPVSTQATGWPPPPQPTTCDNNAPRVRAVKLPAPIFNTVDFSGFAFENGNNIGGFDPVPLLQTQIYVGGFGASCVIAHFSAHVSTGDNIVVFQASIDDVPMEGHGVLPAEVRDLPPLITPVVTDRGTIFSADQPDIRVPTLASYNFFKIVKPGWHTVKIKWAGCCSSVAASVSAEALAAVLTLEYQGNLFPY